jgi:hypothetical protein
MMVHTHGGDASSVRYGETTVLDGEPLAQPPQSDKTPDTMPAEFPPIVRPPTRDQEPTDKPNEQTLESDQLPGHWQDATCAQLSNVGVCFYR